jgi:hypothetical protein
MEDPIPMEVTSRKHIGIRGRNLVFPSPIVADKVKPGMPFTRGATKKNFPVKDAAIETST